MIWECLCDCGNITKASTHSLRSDNTRSCGCLQKEKAAKNGADQFITHGLSRDVNHKKTRLFRIWTGIKTRCFNTKAREYGSYGGRGILLCIEWLDFKIFHTWALNNGYRENLTIERKNNNLGYSPDNCEWIPKGAQAYNRRNTSLIEYNGESKPMSLMAKAYNLTTQTLFSRLERGWTIEKALTEPIQKGHNKH